MSPWKQKPVEIVEISGGLKITVEVRGVAARHRDLWVLIHGLKGSRKTPLMRILLRRLRETGSAVVAPDLPGHGSSGSNVSLLTVERGKEILGKVWEKWGSRSKRMLVLGFSYGGVVGASWCADNPGKAGCLVLCAPSFRMAEERENILSKEIARTLGLPILLLQGECDDTVVWEDTLEFFRKTRSLSQLCIIPGANHVFEGKEERLCHLVRAFWKSLANNDTKAPKK